MQSLFLSDIQKLNKLYNRFQFSFIFLYGRYDTGKTSLIREFCADKKTVFFSARETVPERQLTAFWHETVHCLNPQKIPEPFTDWEQAFSHISAASQAQRLVLVLDEFQYLVQYCPDFFDTFRAAVEGTLPAGKVFLIVTTSSVSYAGQVMQEPLASPFHLITARAFLSSAPFYACQPWLSHYTPREQLLLYGVTGGFLTYLKQIHSQRTAQENIFSLFFRSDSPLLAHPLAHLHRELREISTYNLLLETISNGCTRLAEIAGEADIGTNKCAKYLSVLLSLGILRKETPAVGEVQKKARYVFTDHLLRFWYRFVYPNISSILFGRGQMVYELEVRPALNEYLLPVFEQVCAEYLERLAASGQTPFAYRHTGSWWNGGTKREPFFRIPLVAADDTHTVLGICHCSDAPAGIQLLDGLQNPAEPFGTSERYYCIFSTSGFSAELRQAAKQERQVWLIDLDDMNIS